MSALCTWLLTRIVVRYNIIKRFYCRCFMSSFLSNVLLLCHWGLTGKSTGWSHLRQLCDCWYVSGNCKCCVCRVQACVRVFTSVAAPYCNVLFYSVVYNSANHFCFASFVVYFCNVVIVFNPFNAAGDYSQPLGWVWQAPIVADALSEWDHRILAGVKEGPPDCIRINEVAAALKKMKTHKAPGL